ncbi:amidohydrolase family protein [Nocardia amamiensis]|uniref:amidohydrolase family protein n=1 Tax=Nocardia TaxID=1817 RepID=UPI0033C1559C
MIDDTFVFNAVVHPYNLTDENTQPNRYAQMLREVLVAMHRGWQSFGLDEKQQKTDWPVEAMARTLFLESEVDMAATHTLRLDSYFKDGCVARRKTVEAVKRWPHRFVGYVGLDPTKGLDVSLRELDDQIDELPEAVGLKMYPAQVEPRRHWRMDDRKLLFPILARAQERGIKTVAVHKALPLGPVPLNPYRVDDIDVAAEEFPDLSFEIVHAGMAFGEETALAIGRYPNVYANLEGTTAMISFSPGQFEKAIAQMMFWGGPAKILWADGNMLFHSQPLLENFKNFTFSEETMNTFGIPQITDEDRALILGGNYARILGIDIEAAKAKIADDEFSQEKARTGIQEIYSNWRAALEDVAA